MSGIERIQGAANLNSVAATSGIEKSSGNKNDFFEMVTGGVQGVNEQLQQSDQISKEFLLEGKHNLHEVMIGLEQAEMSFKFLVQVRNKVLDAYNEVMRMQV